MIEGTLDEAANQAGDRYVAFLLSLRGVLGVSLTTDPRDVRAFTTIRNSAVTLAETFLNTEAERFGADLDAVQKIAVGQAHADVVGASSETDVWDMDYRAELVTWFRLELGAQIERDINVISQKRRSLVLQARAASFSLGGDIKTAYFNLLQKGRERVEFYFTDRAGKRYLAQGFARQLYRHGLVTFGVQSYALEAASLGIETVAVTHPDPEHRFNGVLVSLGGAHGAQDLSEVMDEVFHPNSRAFLKAETA